MIAYLLLVIYQSALIVWFVKKNKRGERLNYKVFWKFFAFTATSSAFWLAFVALPSFEEISFNDQLWFFLKWSLLGVFFPLILKAVIKWEHKRYPEKEKLVTW